MAPRKMSSRQLVQELTEHNDFFDVLVDMFPSHLYIAAEPGTEDDYHSKYHKSQSAESKSARKAAAKAAKRQRLDPSQVETTVEKKKRLDKSNEQKGLLPRTSQSEPDDMKQSASPSSGKSRIEALRDKLHSKIAAKRGQRPSNPNQVSKRAARRAEKRRHQEEAMRKKKANNSSAESKSSAPKYTVEDETKSRMNDLQRLGYGRLTGLNNKRTSSNYLESNKALANLSKSKNLAKVLADAEAKRQKLEELKKGSEEDKAKAASMQWSDTFKEADGQRVKEDPTMLRKAMKRKAAKKAKSQKAWKSRLEQTSAAKDERQRIRQHNLSARKQGGRVGANLSRKRIVDGEDEGRRLSRAGFEGRKQDFLNSGKE